MSKIYRITEIFSTVQGEGLYMGRKALFIRFAGCNLACSFCFGSRKKAPRLRVADQVDSARSGKRGLRLEDVEIGQEILTMDERTLDIVKTKVVNKMSRDVEQWQEIKIDNHIYEVTPEHPFFTARGMVEARDLIAGDQILHCSNSDFKKYKKETRDPILVRETSEKISKSKIGNKNPNWAEGHKDRNFISLKKEISQGKHKCQVCDVLKSKGGKSLEVHHIDEDKSNDSLDNLMPVCHQCHSKIHKRGYNFWKNRKDGKVLAKAVSHNGKEVIYNKPVDITTHKHYGRPYGPKRLNVTNISCSPHNTYLVDDMWVHNCDTDFSYADYEVTLEGLADIIGKFYAESKTGFDHIVLTGGEPLQQVDEELMTYLTMEAGYVVQIETNGTMPASFMGDYENNVEENLVYITCSPKAKKIHEDLIPHISEMKIVLFNKKFVEHILDTYHNKFGVETDSPCNTYIQPVERNGEMNVLEVQKFILSREEDLRMTVQTQKIGNFA